jgi:exodeoxyribonuclease VII large subunit
VPVRAELLITVTQHGLRVATSLRRRIEGDRHRFAGLARGLPRKANILDLPRQRFDNASGRLKQALLANARVHRSAFERSASRLRPQSLVRAAQAGRDRLIRLERARSRSIGALVDRSRAKLDAQAKLLFTLGYHNVLARGFALVRASDGAMLRRASEVRPGAALDIEFADGHVAAHADSGERSAEPAAKLRFKRGDEKQGSLL